MISNAGALKELLADISQLVFKGETFMRLKVTYRQGGMYEFARTGEYPRKLLVYDPTLNKRWWRKISEEKNAGELKIGDKTIFRFHVDIDLQEVKIFNNNGTLIDDYEVIFELSD